MFKASAMQWHSTEFTAYGNLPDDVRVEVWYRISKLYQWGLLYEVASSTEEVMEKVIPNVLATAMTRENWFTNQATGPAQQLPTGELVYYVRFGDRVKIGTTTNIANRLRDIPHDELLATEAGGRDVEARRHVQFGRHRIKGEWFHYNDVLKAHVERLNAA